MTEVKPCPGCGDPSGPCPHQSCVHYEPYPVDFSGEPLEIQKEEADAQNDHYRRTGRGL